MEIRTELVKISTIKIIESPYVALIIFGIMLIFGSAPLVAASVQSSETLRQIALTFLQEKTASLRDQEAEIIIGRIDQRLRLPECATTPTAFLSTGSKLQGKVSVGMRCMGEKPWTVYIPAQIKNFAQVVVAAHSLPRGTQISDADVMTVRQDISQLRGDYFTEHKNIVGNILKIPMSAGKAFSATGVKPPLLVHRGDEVIILATVGGLKVRGKGKALEDASLGQRISVRNIQSKRIVQGTAVKSGTVSVQM